MTKFKILATAAVVGSGLLAPLAQAGIVSVSGTVTQISAPPSVVVNSGLESNTTAFIFAEQQDVTLGAAVAVNASAPGIYNSPGSLTSGSIAAGSVVSSYYYHADSVGTRNSVTYRSTIVFDTDILGIIVNDNTLIASDWLGSGTTAYGTNNRGFEMGSAPGFDSFSISINGRTLTILDTTTTLSDDMRIITAVPEPAAPWLVAAALGGLVLTRSRRKPV
jgi:hypothetical protein